MGEVYVGMVITALLIVLLQKVFRADITGKLSAREQSPFRSMLSLVYHLLSYAFCTGVALFLLLGVQNL